MRCLNPTRNTFEFTSNIGGNQTFEFFKNSRYTNLPAFKVYANNNTIVYSQAALENIIQKFLPKNVFAVQHLNNLVDKLPIGAKAAFFKDVLYFGENVSKEEIAEETFHAIFQRLLPENIKAKYLEEGKGLVENIEKQIVELKTSQPTIYGSLTKEEAKERIIEEAIAKAYVDYFVKNTTPTNKKNDVLSLLHNFFKWLKNLFFSAKQNQNQLEILFEDILKGNFTKSTIQNENESPVPTLRLIEYTGVDETGNPVRKNLSNKESDMMVASIASIVIELDEKLTREQKEQLDLRTRSKRINKAIEELRKYYLKKGDEFKASALEEYSEETVNMETGEEEEFVSPSLQNLKEDVAKYLNVVTGKSIKDEEDNNENDEAELQGGDTIAANEKGFDQLSAWIRNYISTTGRFVDSFQIEGISTPINIYEVVDKGKIYYSLARAMQNSTTEIERLYKLVEIANLGTNKDTRLLVQRVAKDVLKNPKGLKDEELFQEFRENVKNLYEKWKGNKKENRLIINDIKNLDVQKQFILQTLLQGFNLWNRDNYQVNVSIKTKGEEGSTITTKVHQANQHSASEVQLQMWENYFLNVRDELTEREINRLISNITSSSDLENNLTKAFTILFGGVDGTYINYLITPTSDNSIGGTYTAEGTIEDVVAMLNIVVEDLKQNDSILFDNDQGAVSRLTKFAKNTSKVNEDVIEATYKDAENKTRYSYQNKTFQLFMFNEFLNSNHIEEYKTKISSGQLYEYSEEKYLEQASRFLYDGKNSERTSLNHVLFLDAKDELNIDAKKWQEALSNGAYYSMDGLTTDSGATTFGGMENRDFFLYKLHLMSNRTNTSQPIHINLMEAKRTTSFKEVMLLEGLYNDEGITKKGTQLFANEIIKEIKRMHDEKSKVKNWLQLILSEGVPENKIVELTRENVIKASTVSDAEGVIEKYHTGNYKVVLDENNNIVDFFVDAKGARAFNFTDNLKGIVSPALFKRLKELYFNVPDSFEDVYTKIKANDKFYGEVAKDLTDYLNSHQVEVEKLKGLLPVSKRYGDLNSTPFVQQQSNFKNDVLSQWINTIWVNQLINSDSALLVKNDGADFVKRAGGQNAAIQSLVTAFIPPTGYGITKKDNLSKTRYVVGTDPKGIVSFKPKKANGKDNEVDSADAQSYNTVHAYRKYLYGIGKLSNEIAQLLNKVELGVPFTSLDMEVMKEKNVYFNVLKPVGYDGYFYFKTGTLMLGRELTSHWVGETDRNTLFEEGRFAELNLESNWVAKAGREPLHNLRTAMEKNNVDYYLGQTASKQLTINKFSKEFKTLPDSLKDDEEFASSINVMDTNFFGQQMENPSGKTSVIDPSQMLEIILNEQNENVFVRIDGVEVEIKQAIKDWVRLSKNRDNLKFTEALNEIANDDFSINYNRFLDKVKETLLSSGAEDQLIEFFSKDDKGNPNYNLNMSVTIDKFVNLLMSHFSKGVLQQKVAGDSLALVSSEGLKGIKKLIKYKAKVGDEYKDVYSWEWLNENSAEYDSILRSNSYHTITDVEYSEFDTNDQITGSLSPLNQTLKDLYEGDGQVRYVVDELRFGVPVWKTTGEMVDGIPVVHATPEYYASESLYPSYEKGVKNTKELQGSFAVRIPSQDKHSATNITWSGMLPSYYGNTISVAKEIEYLSGSDFDIDKLFLHRKEIYKNENGDWVVWSMKDHTFAKYVNYHAKNNKTVKRYLKTALTNDSRYAEFLKEIDKSKLEHVALKKEVSDEYSSDESYRKSLNIKTLEDEIHKIDLELERFSFTPEVLQYSFVSETVEKLQLDKAFLQEGIEWKKELKERLENDYYKNKLQRIRDRIHTLNEDLNKVIEFHLYPIFKDLKLIQTKEEFDRRAGDGEVLIHPIINNQLLELKQRFLTNQETLKRGEREAIALTPATQDNLKELLSKSFVNVNGVPTMLFQDAKGNDRFTTDMKWSTHSQLGQLQAHRNVVTGKRNIGVAVVSNLMHLFAKKSERSLLSPIQLYDVDKNNNLILNTLFSFKNAINERGNRIADILSELVSAATDETKDQQNAKYNLSMEALNIVTPMLMLGASLESAILLVNHPDVQKYLQLVGKKGLILKTQKEITESQRTNEDVLQDLMLNKENLGTPSILHFKDGRNGYGVLNLVSKMLQISKEVGAANYIISLKKGLGKDLDSFEAGEEKIDSTTKEKVPQKALTNIATVFAEYNPMLEQYQNQIEIHDKIARLFDTNLIRRNSTYKELYSIFKANFKTSSYDKFVKWMNDSVLGFVYSKAYFDSLTDNKEKYTQYTNEALENTEKKWWDFVKDLKTPNSEISDEKKKDLLENLFVKKIRKGKKNSEIRIPTFVKSDVSTSSTLTDAFLDMHIKLTGTKWETLSRELFHYFVHKDTWIFKGGSLSKGIHPLFFKDHSRSLDEAVKNKQFLKDVPTGLLAYLAIEKATNTLEGSKEIKRVNQKNSSFLSPILSGTGFSSKNLFKLEETQIQSLIENGYMEIREGKFKVLTPPLYHKFSVQVVEGVYDTQTMKLETVTISVGGKQYTLNAKDYFANRDKIYKVVGATYTETVTGNEKSLSLPLTQRDLDYTNYNVFSKLGMIDDVEVEFLRGEKIISNEDVENFNKFNSPKEFFTPKTLFKQFYNTETGKRQTAPSNSKWILNPNSLYDLVDLESGEQLISNVDLSTGYQMVVVEKEKELLENENKEAETANLNVEQQQDVVGQIYSEISKYSENQTQSKYVILPKDVDPEADNIGMTYTTAIDFWRNIVPEAVALFNKSKPLIVAFRGNSKKTFLENYKSGTHTIGNPFDWRDETQTKDRKEQGIASTKKFIEWMITGNSFENENATEEYRQTIITDIKSGKIKGSSILYYEEKGYATHATALDFLINKYDWNQQQPNLNQQGSKDSVKKDFIRVKGYFITTNYENSYDGSFINYRVYNNNNEYFFNYYENSRVSVPNEISWHLNQKGINISWDDVEEMFKNIDKNNDIYKEIEKSKKLNQPLPPTPNQSTEEGTDATCPIS
mgnify:FL=1